MKRLLFLFLFLSACGVVKYTANITNSDTIYQGIIPCADCDGIEEIVILQSDINVYTIKTKYIGESDEYFIEKGKVQKRKEILKLGNNYYKTFDDYLLKLDMKGREIKSKLNYKLLKQ
ncbi:MAG: hypothetical protein Ta2D_09810 [Rickettsiales bacterium]|nr:MAG: hypothetical protein Ta2D_09810 [Rickettsiales bacterium]